MNKKQARELITKFHETYPEVRKVWEEGRDSLRDCQTNAVGYQQWSASRYRDARRAVEEGDLDFASLCQLRAAYLSMRARQHLFAII